MSEKIYDAIYKVAKNAESDIVVLWMGHHTMVKGILLDCEDNKCIHDVITLQDAVVICHHEEKTHEKRLRWINIPACHIKAFTFDCCVIDD